MFSPHFFFLPGRTCLAKGLSLPTQDAAEEVVQKLHAMKEKPVGLRFAIEKEADGYYLVAPTSKADPKRFRDWIVKAFKTVKEIVADAVSAHHQKGGW